MGLSKRLYAYRRLEVPKPHGLLLDPSGNIKVEPRRPRKQRPKTKKPPYGSRLPCEERWLFPDPDTIDPNLVPPWEDE